MFEKTTGFDIISNSPSYNSVHQRMLYIVGRGLVAFYGGYNSSIFKKFLLFCNMICSSKNAM